MGGIGRVVLGGLAALAMLAAAAEDQPPMPVSREESSPLAGDTAPDAGDAAPDADEGPAATEPDTLSESRAATPVSYGHNAKPVYPTALRRLGNDGFVLASVQVSKEGLPQKIQILESAHPLLEQATVAALVQWRFTPATIDNQPTEASIRVPFKFSLNGGVATEPYKVTKASKKQPHEPAQVRLAVGAAYPYELLKKGSIGHATLNAMVGTDGRVHAVEVVKASHPDFGHAAKAMLEAWTFRPATHEGKPVPSTVKYTKRFSREEADIVIDPEAYPLLRTKESSRPRAHSLAELDAAPRVVYQPMPVVSPKLRAEGVKDKVLVEFYVNSAGTVLLPRAIEFSNVALAWSAVTAVARWRFEPPLKEGKPVLARLRVPLAF